MAQDTYYLCMAGIAPTIHPAAPSDRRLPLQVRRHALVAHVARQLQQCGVKVDSNGTATKVVIGVSGGADSTALLLACAAIAQRSDRRNAFVQPIAVNVHHHLRESADDDATFVSDLCKQLSLELLVCHVYPARLKGNLYANARDLRYDALREVAAKCGAAFVAVAHHAEDQLETMLMALCRGAGLEGLSAMNLRRDLGKGVSLIRPMLRVRKSQCEDLCKAAGIAWREDPSNEDAGRSRARLRRDVIPVLEELWPDAALRVSASAEVLQVAGDLMERTVEAAFGPATICEWQRSRLRELPLLVIAAGLHRAALAFCSDVADQLKQDHLLDAASAIADQIRKPRSFVWPGGLRLLVRSREVRLTRIQDSI
jgi:tRNA(Ile)-lysidine synthetase-like protein